MRKHALALMSSTEIRDIPKQDSVLLIPVGCVEQHGPAGYTGAVISPTRLLLRIMSYGFCGAVGFGPTGSVIVTVGSA